MGASWSSTGSPLGRGESSNGASKWWFSSLGGTVHHERAGASGAADASSPQAIKRQRRMVEHVQILPGLPDEIALQVLARVPRGWQPAMKMVCNSWNHVMSSREVFNLRRELEVTEQWLYVLMKDKEDELVWFALDPLTAEWRRIPPMPEVIQDCESRESSSGWGLWGAIGSSGHAISGIFKGLFGRKDSSERMPFFGCSAAELDGCLFVLGGFLKASATACVWRYDPRSNEWTQAAGMGTPRAYCKTGLLDRKLYAVGGVNRGRNGLTPLQSAEVYDPDTNTWTPIPNMPFMGAQVLPTAFVTDILKPIATGMAALKGQLWVPQSLYSWPFFMDVGGEVYDPSSNNWSDMPRGMGEGWPARQAGMKLSVVVNGNLYSLDPMSSLDGSKIKVYDFEHDCWKVVVKKVPVLLDLTTDSESPYLLCCLKSGLHVVTKDVNNNVTVLRADISRCANSDRGSSRDSEAECWTVVSAKNFGRVELVACQVLEI